MRDTDVLVVGGGPVGLAAAIHARAAGYDVVVLERRTPPLDKACGEGLLPGALREILALGIDPPGHELMGISYRDRDRTADRLFATPGRGVRRTVLHAALTQRAADAGVRVERGHVTTIAQDPTGVSAGGLRARWLVGCDGLHSRVRREIGLEGPPVASGRYGLRRHYRVEPWSSLVEVHWAPAAEVYVTPVGPHLVGLAVLGRRGVDHAGALAALPRLASCVAGAEHGPELGAGPLRQNVRGRAVGRVLLAGDSAGYVDALTGEGLRLGLAQARAAIRHLDDPPAYERAWHRITRDYRTMTRLLVAWAQSPLRGALVPAAAMLPGAYGAVVDRLAR